VTRESYDSTSCIGIACVLGCCLVLVGSRFFFLQLAQKGDLLLCGELLLRSQGRNSLDGYTEVLSRAEKIVVGQVRARFGAER